jgi:catechol 2,3-dioxygenase-like lactoylglutathione lyase family enzyme
MLDLAPIHHVKIPVSDVRASTDWYQRVLGLAVAIEFTEETVPQQRHRTGRPA